MIDAISPAYRDDIRELGAQLDAINQQLVKEYLR